MVSVACSLYFKQTFDISQWTSPEVNKRRGASSENILPVEFQAEEEEDLGHSESILHQSIFPKVTDERPGSYHQRTLVSLQPNRVILFQSKPHFGLEHGHRCCLF